MKKLYRKGTVHPSPPPTAAADFLSFLPAAILTLAAALSPEDKEVLGYLISCSSTNFPNFSKKKSRGGGGGGGSGHDHPPLFSCDCFSCYMSYWVRWDLSPNRELIHEIIDAYEDGLAQGKKGKGKKERKKRGVGGGGGGEGSGELNRPELSLGKEEMGELESVEGCSSSGGGGTSGGGDGEICGGGDCNSEEGGGEKGSVRKFVSFVGEKIWGVWG